MRPKRKRGVPVFRESQSKKKKKKKKKKNQNSKGNLKIFFLGVH